MTFPHETREKIPRMSSWVTTQRIEALENVALLSRAMLCHLHLVFGRADGPHALLRDRFALRATEACVAVSGRPDRAGDLRDAIH